MMDYQMNEVAATEDLMKRTPQNSSVHPLEEAERSYREGREKAEERLAAKTFGIGFTLHLKHERAAARCPQIGHLGVLKRHNAMYNSLTGGDLDFDFSDTLAIEQELNLPTYKVLDGFHKQNYFKK